MMNKIICTLTSFLLLIAIVSCDKSEIDFKTYYGVVGYIDLGEDNQSVLSVNIPEIGWVALPNIEIDACKEGTHIDDYEVQVGDILKIYFEDVNDVSILESFPGQFSIDPTSIDVFNYNNVYIEKLDNGAWIFEVQKDDISTDATFYISDLEEGNIVYFEKNEVIAKQPTQSFLCEALIETIKLETITFIIDDNDISSLLEYYYWGNTTLSNVNYFN